MGQISVNLGFDAATGHVTVDGKPHGEPVDFDAILKRVMATIERRRTHYQRLMNGTSRKAIVWGTMPKPDGDA